MKILNIILLTFSLFLSTNSFAESKYESENAEKIEELTKQIKLLTVIQDEVMETDIARIEILKIETQAFIDELKKFSLGSKTITRRASRYYIKFKYSGDLFTEIKAEPIEFSDGTIEKLSPEVLAYNKSIDDALGIFGFFVEEMQLDQRDTSLITQYTFEEMASLFRELMKNRDNYPAEISAKVSQCMKAALALSSYAAKGDRPKVFKQAEKVFEYINNRYEALDDFALEVENKDFYSKWFQIQGLIAFYDDFTRFGEEDESVIDFSQFDE